MLRQELHDTKPRELIPPSIVLIQTNNNYNKILQPIASNVAKLIDLGGHDAFEDTNHNFVVTENGDLSNSENELDTKDLPNVFSSTNSKTSNLGVTENELEDFFNKLEIDYKLKDVVPVNKIKFYEYEKDSPEREEIDEDLLDEILLERTILKSKLDEEPILVDKSNFNGNNHTNTELMRAECSGGEVINKQERVTVKSNDTIQIDVCIIINTNTDAPKISLDVNKINSNTQSNPNETTSSNNSLRERKQTEITQPNVKNSMQNMSQVNSDGPSPSTFLNDALRRQVKQKVIGELRNVPGRNIMATANTKSDNISTHAKLFTNDRLINNKHLTMDTVKNVPLMKTANWDEKVFSKKSIIKSDAAIANLTKGPSLYEKSLTLPRIMQRLEQRKKRLTERSMEKSLGDSLTHRTKCKSSVLHYPSSPVATVANCSNSKHKVTQQKDITNKKSAINFVTLKNDCNTDRLMEFKRRQKFESFVRNGQMK